MDSVLYAFLWFAIALITVTTMKFAGGWVLLPKDYPKGEWYEIKPNLYGWEWDLKPGQKPLSAYYWHYGEPEPTFHEYKHIDEIIKHVKKTYKELPF